MKVCKKIDRVEVDYVSIQPDNKNSVDLGKF